jgi:radical SAM superfamily enzyme YgiQ (UPF0313 family)
MSSKILLISTNRFTVPDPVFPLGLACVNAALIRAGHQTECLDASIDSPERVQSAISAFCPDFIGVSLRNIDDVLIRKQETSFGESISICGLIRKQIDCPIIMGGAGYSIFPARLLELTGADYGVCGEGEDAVVALIDALEKGQDPESISGLVFRQSGRIVVNEPACMPLDHSARFAFRPERWVSHYLQTSGMLNIQTQRGCSLHCCFCTYPLIEGRRHRRRSADAVAAEMQEMSLMGARYVFVVDAVFNSSSEHVEGVCEAILRAGVKMSWGCFLRPCGLTPPLMKLMARAGLTHVEFGSESFSDSVLAAYGKGLSFEDILHSSELAHAENIDCCHFLICGGPGETKGTLEDGFKNSLRLKNPVIMPVVGMRVYPGTPLCRRAVAEGRISESTDLLTPTYYLAPGLTSEGVFEQLRLFTGQSPAWLPGDATPAYASLVSQLRKRGVMGPLWSYFAMTQRIWPQPNS